MRLTNTLRTSSRRSAILVALLLLGASGAVAAWIVGEPVLSAVTGGATVVVILLLKTVMELVYDVEHQQTRFTAETGATSDRLQNVEESAEETGRVQQSFNEAVLNRVRAVETSAGKQQSFNEAVLNRVRAVETSAGKQQSFSDAVLDRVRALERRSTELVEVLESLQSFRDHGVGDHRELQLARALRRLKSQITDQSQ